MPLLRDDRPEVVLRQLDRIVRRRAGEVEEAEKAEKAEEAEA